MSKFNYHAVDGTRVRSRTTNEEINAAIAEFIAKGGKPFVCKEDDGSYDKALKKNQKHLGGCFNPFSKAEALQKN